MTRKHSLCHVAVVAALSAAVVAEALAGTATPSTILVMPARRRLVELASQIIRIKDVGLVAYDNRADLAEPLLHIWNGSEWLQISVDDYVAGNFMSGEPQRLIVLGDQNTLPSRMAADPAWCRDVRRISTLDTAPLLNELDKTLKFSGPQWRWLADQNGLELVDHNAERRRYGRWGASGKEAVPPPSKPSKLELPPSPPTALRSTVEPATTPAAAPVKEEPQAAVPATEPAIKDVEAAPVAAPETPEVKPEAKVEAVEAPEAKPEDKPEAPPAEDAPAVKPEAKAEPAAPEAAGQAKKPEDAKPAEANTAEDKPGVAAPPPAPVVEAPKSEDAPAGK
jgi:hypothetical protein